MEIYIDLFFVFNIVIDMIIIMGVSYLLRRKVSIVRLLLSSLIGGISSLLLFTNVNRLLIGGISIIFMTLCAYGYKDIKYMLNNIIYMYIVSVLLGGIIYLFNIRVTSGFLYYLIIIVIGLEVTILYVKEMHKFKKTYNNYYHVDIYFERDSLSLIGFVDTGNNLYDPYGKRPIIILNRKYEYNDGYLLVPYYTASGNGLLKCVKPKIVFVDGKKVKDVLVGFSDNVKLEDGIDVILHKDIVKGD